MSKKARLIAGVACVVSGMGAGSAVAAPHPTGAFDFKGSLERSSGWGTFGYAKGYPAPSDEPGFADVAIPGSPRTPWTVLDVPPGTVVSSSVLADDWWSEDPPRTSWTVALLVSLDDAGGPFRLFSVGRMPGNLSVVVEDGRLHYPGGVSGTTTLQENAWHQIVFSRDNVSDTFRAYVDGQPDVTLDDAAENAVYEGSVGFFEYEEWSQTPSPSGGGDVARLRGWRHALSDADVAALDRLDATPPSIAVIEPGEGANAGLRPRFFGSRLDDDGSDKPNILTGIVIKDGEGEVAATYPTQRASMYGPQQDWVRDWPGGTPALVRGRRYTAEITATDGAGNTTTLEREIVADDPPPAMVIHEPGAETADATPHLAGWTTRWEGDIGVVHANILIRDEPGWRGVSSLLLELEQDGDFAGDFIDPVPPGDYELRVTHVDEGARTAIVQQPLRILGPAGREDRPPPPQAQPGGPPSGHAEAGALRRATIAALRRTRARRLAGRGTRVRFPASAAGRASLTLLLRGRVVARGVRNVREAGRATMLVRPSSGGRTALRRIRRARLKIRSTYAPVGGRAVTATGFVTVSR